MPSAHSSGGIDMEEFLLVMAKNIRYSKTIKNTHSMAKYVKESNKDCEFLSQTCSHDLKKGRGGERGAV